MVKIGRKIFYLILGFFSTSFPAFVFAAVTVQATVDRNEMEIGDTFQVYLTVISDEEIDISGPRPPNFEGFELLNRSDQKSVGSQLVNTGRGMQFKTQIRQDFVYYLAARKLGSLSIDSFDVGINGKTHRTNPILIKVVESGKGSKSKGKGKSRLGPQPQDIFDQFQEDGDEIFNQLLQGRRRLLEEAQRGLLGQGGGPFAQDEPQSRQLNINEKDAFFVLAEVDKTEVYEGEQITVNWYIYTRGLLETLERLKFPDLRGFWKEVLEEVPAYQPIEEIVNGISYKKALLASHALFPIKAGSAVIDEFKIRSRVRLPLTNYGTFGYGQAFEYTKTSKRIPIKILPLPVEGRPKDFSGAVGSYEVTAAVDNKSPPVNQPLTLKIRFQGTGNAKLIELPPLNLPEGIEIYETKSDSKFFKDGRSYKEFTVLLVPHQIGPQTIPAISVSMFDPSQKKYISASTESLQINVVENNNLPNTVTSEIDKGGVGATKGAGADTSKKSEPILVLNLSSNDFFPLKKDFRFWLVVYLILGIVLLLKARKELGWGLRSQTISQQIERRWQVVEQALIKSDYRKVGVEVINIFYLSLGASSGNTGGAQEFEKLLEQLLPSLRANYGKQLVQSFEYFQTIGFAPEEMLGSLKSLEVLREQVGKAKEVVQKIL